MPPKTKRLSAEMAKIVATKGVSNRSEWATLKRVPSKDLRMGVSVSKKVTPSSVVRNTIRRKIYPALANALKEKTGHYFLQVYKDVSKLPTEDIIKKVNNIVEYKQ